MDHAPSDSKRSFGERLANESSHQRIRPPSGGNKSPGERLTIELLTNGSRPVR